MSTQSINAGRGLDDARLTELERRTGHTFEKKGLLVRALTHSSYVNEHNLSRMKCNERLEFLGDAVLELCSSRILFDTCPQKSEGQLTMLRASLVSEAPLAAVAARLGLGEMLRMGRGEAQSGGAKRPSILSDALEAIIGALYLDGGLDAAMAFVARNIINSDSLDAFTDTKSKLQEIAQKDGNDPVYCLVSESGPDHDKTFVSEVSINGSVLGRGTGSTKKKSEQAAAAEALSVLEP